MSKIEFAREGNFPNIRALYFKFRAFCMQYAQSAGKKGIDYRKITEAEQEFIRKEIRSNPVWTASQAFKLNNILAKFQTEMDAFGINLKENHTEPQQVTVSWNGRTFIVSFYNPQQDMSNDFKRMIRSKVHRSTLEGMYWEVFPDEAATLKKFCKKYPSIVDSATAKKLDKFINTLERSYSSSRVELSIPLKMELRDYQTVGVKYHLMHRRSMNCDTMGLGKSFQAIAAAVALQNFPYIIVCPKSLRRNWMNEIEKFTYSKAVVLDKDSVKQIKNIHRAGIDFFITNYEGVASLLHKKVGNRLVPKPALFEFNGACFDEAHRLKNKSTRAFITCKTLAHSVSDLHLLTGTPVDKSPMEVWALIELLRYNDYFGGETYFKNLYKKIAAAKFDEVQNAEAKLKGLNNKLRTICMIRREKHIVANELPETSTIVLEYEPDDKQKTTLEKAIDGIKQWAKRKKSESKTGGLTGGETLIKLNELGKTLGVMKAEFVASIVTSIVASGEQIVIFAHHYAVIDAFKKHYPDFVELSGRIKKDADIDRNVKDFQSGKVKVIVCNYIKASQGFTLTAASKWLALEYPWTYKDLEQARARVHRIGTKFPVEYYLPVVKDSVDVYRLALINNKKKVFSNAVDSKAEWNINSESENALAIMDLLLE